jgi:hypothetical protein
MPYLRTGINRHVNSERDITDFVVVGYWITTVQLAGETCAVGGGKGFTRIDAVEVLGVAVWTAAIMITTLYRPLVEQNIECFIPR